MPQAWRRSTATVRHIAEAEGRAALQVLEKLGDDDWRRPTDCVEWDVRTLVSHLVAQCEDNISLRTMLRREIEGRRRHRGKGPIDAHMAAQVEDHTEASGPDLVAEFAELWPRAVQARRSRPGLMRRANLDTGMPTAPGCPSATCSTPSTTATYGCTASIWHGRRDRPSPSAITTGRSSNRPSATWPWPGPRHPSPSNSPDLRAEPG
ncbi:hypothetical protein E4K10_41830 [Streptomyces sp. T1317-0309]|nr:hypothetical protein E4K10_41830 [Streptomyces sp. T1317-0309]